jgi:hypothetical protein
LNPELFELWGRIEAAVKLPRSAIKMTYFVKESIDFCWTQFVPAFSEKGTAVFLGSKSIPP